MRFPDETRVLIATWEWEEVGVYVGIWHCFTAASCYGFLSCPGMNGFIDLQGAGDYYDCRSSCTINVCIGNRLQNEASTTVPSGEKATEQRIENSLSEEQTTERRINNCHSREKRAGRRIDN